MGESQVATLIYGYNCDRERCKETGQGIVFYG